MERNRKLWWLSQSLLILASVLFPLGIYTGHMSLDVIALITGVLGLSLDLWARSSPRRPTSLVQPSKHPILTNVLFSGIMLVLAIALVYTISLDPRPLPRLGRGAMLSAAFVGYNLLLALVRYVRTPTQN